MRIESLTFLRFVAAFIVVVFHFGKKATGWGGFLVSGPQMVTFFFVLSGFVMAVAYGGKSKVPLIPYLRSRLARLVPIYWIALILVIILQLVRDYTPGLTPLNLGLNFTLLQSWPLGFNSLNFPGWSLSVELFFYIAFPCTLFLFRHLMRWPLALCGGVFAFWACLQLGLSELLLSDDVTTINQFIDYSPISHFPSFVMGVMGGLFFRERGWFRSSGFWALVGTLLAGTLIVLSLNHPGSIERALGRPLAFRSSLHAPLFLLLILCLASSRWRWSDALAWKPLVLLGESSYSFYILQLPIFQLHVMYLRPHVAMGSLLDFIVYTSILVAVSIATYRWIELPLNRYLRSKSTIPNQV